MNKTLLKSIESFPPLRESINQINAICNNDNVDLKALVRIIEADPMLYTDILRYSNAPHHGFSHTIISINQVISLFGVFAIRGMALTAALKAHPFSDLTAYGTTVDKWFKVMEQQQRFLDLWLMKTHRSILQSLGGLTFILEIGRLAASYVLTFKKNSYSFSKCNPYELSLEEKNIIGLSGDELASELFKMWYFDEMLADSLCHSLSPSKGINPEICAVLECARTLFTLNGIEPFEYIEATLQQYNLPLSNAKLAYETLLREES